MRCFLPILCLLAGCASYDLTKGEAVNDASGTGSDGDWDTGGGGQETDNSDTGSGGGPPASYTVEASLTITDGLPSTEGAGVNILVVAEDNESLLCTVPLNMATLEAATSDSADVPAWWTLEVDPSERPCATLPTRLSLGIGALAIDAVVQIDTSDLGDLAESLYGAYISESGGPTYVYGWAGTKLDRAGDDLATLPPPDGVYSLVPLYLLALP